MKEDSLAYGVLIKNDDDYEYFRHYIRDSQLRNALFITKFWPVDRNNYAGHYYSNIGDNALFSSQGDPFQLTMIVLVATIGAIFLFGFFFEIHRRNISSNATKRGGMNDDCLCDRQNLQNIVQ